MLKDVIIQGQDFYHAKTPCGDRTDFVSLPNLELANKFSPLAAKINFSEMDLPEIEVSNASKFDPEGMPDAFIADDGYTKIAWFNLNLDEESREAKFFLSVYDNGCINEERLESESQELLDECIDDVILRAEHHASHIGYEYPDCSDSELIEAVRQSLVLEKIKMESVLDSLGNWNIADEEKFYQEIIQVWVDKGLINEDTLKARV